MLLSLLFIIAGCETSERAREAPHLGDAPSAQASREDDAQGDPTDEPTRKRGEPSSGNDHRCLRVVDGDTIVVERFGKRRRVRLLRIDTPEKGEQHFAEAKKALASLVAGKKVRLEFEVPGVEAEDDYGRLLAYVFVDEKLINAEMVRQGWSDFETRFGKGRLAEHFIAAERGRTKRAE